MRKIVSNLFILALLIVTLLAIILSTIGFETNKFNNLISKKINLLDNNVDLQLISVKFKLDIKEISLFLETTNPQINYRNNYIPTNKINVYIDFISLLKSEPKIKKIKLIINDFDIKQLKNLSTSLKPSNFTTFIKNKVTQGKLNSEIEIYFKDNNSVENFIARGKVKNLTAEVTNNIILEKTNFNFFADKSDILLKNIFSTTESLKISEGDLKLKLSSDILLETNFKTNLKFNDKLKKNVTFIKDIKYTKNLSNIEAILNNSVIITFDKTYKIKKYIYKNSGRILDATYKLEKPFKNPFLDKEIVQLSLINSEIKTSFSPEKNIINILGKYSLNEERDSSLPFNFDSILNKEYLNIKLNADFNKKFELKFINYSKSRGTNANIDIDLYKQKGNIELKKINLVEGKNSISIKNMNINNGKFLFFDNINVKTSKNGKRNNDFSISYNKKILVTGNKFDARNLAKFVNQSPKKNIFPNVNKNIKIDLSNIIAPLSENLKNFKLIGKIKKGKFTKISSKGDFGGDNYLDITMKEDENSNKKYLEIYSDLTRPLLAEYDFFKGLAGGKLLFSSIIDGEKSNSKLKIENFNVINAPGMVKLLSLADLSGLADLAEGDGISFDTLEINMKKNKDSLILNEILALGPSISVLMEGYQDNKLTSLRGTLIPAKTLNKLISKIPVLGNIIIPKEIGEGLFGVSFKMKGPPGKIETTINPIRTITPRFIQKIVDRNKKN